MVVDHREAFMREVQADLSDKFEPETVKTVMGAMLVRFAGYKLEPEDTQLATIDYDNERFLKLYLATKKVEGRSDKTIERYGYIIRRMHKDTGVGIHEITIYHLRSYLAQLQIGGMCLNSISGIRSIFTAYFGWLFREGLLDHDPSVQLGKVKVEQKIEMPFNLSDIEKLRVACHNYRDRALLEFLRSTGCRIDEVVRLNRSDVNPAALECKVHGKGNKERIVYFDDVCAIHLKWYLDSRKDNSPALFSGLGNRTERLTDDGVRIALKRLEREAGIENVHPHRFRRTLATSLIRYGVPVQDVGRVLGHVNLNTTLRYVHIDDVAVKTEYRRYTR